MTPEEAVEIVQEKRGWITMNIAISDAIIECHRLAKAFLELEDWWNVGTSWGCYEDVKRVREKIQQLKTPPNPDPELAWKGEADRLKTQGGGHV